MGGDESGSDLPDLPLDKDVYISDEDDTFEKMKRGLKKFGKDLKKGAGDIADSSKKLASKSKEKMDSALEERKRKKAMKDPLTFPWNKLTVSELKDNLKALGLKVSGKKDDLVERILEHYRTEIPADEDGTPHLIEDLDPVDEIPAAPDLEEVVEDVEVEEVVVEPDPMLDEVAEGTPLYQLGDSEQLYVHDPPKNINILDNSTRKVSNSINLIYGLMMFGLTISILNNGFDMRINFGIIYDFISERFINSYGGMNDIQVASLAGLLSLLFFFSALMYISGHQFIAALTAKCAVVSSIVIRLLAYLFENNFGGVDIFGDLILDLMFLIPFSLSIWVPSMLKTNLSNEALNDTGVFLSPMEPISGTDLGEYFTINALSGYIEGDEMSEFQVTKPKRPSRRGRVNFFYEGMFLLASLVLWCFSVGFLIIFSLNISTRYGDWTVDSIPAFFLPVLFILAITCTFVVYRYDRDARDGPLYAKEKASYHEQMDQYSGLKNAYYELQAKKLEVQADVLPGHNEGN